MLNSIVTRISKPNLESFVNKLFIAAGLDEEQSFIIARHLVLANLRGVDSHGVSRVAIYTKRLDHGLVNKTMKDEMIRETNVSALIDGGNSMGIPLATKGIRLAVEKAKKHGIGIVGINHSNHCGMLADYSLYAAQNDCIALATTNAPANMAPWGGRERFFGTNPFSYGLPTGGTPVVFDMATSIVARGKILLANKNNEEIPIGWAISKEGKPTTNAKEALEGLVLPMAGYKGYGVAFLVETLSALFTGAAFGPNLGDLYNDFSKPQNTGHFFLVMKADLFQEIELFKERMDQMIQEVKSVSLMEDVERIYLPGEIELEKAAEREKYGIPVSEEVIRELVSVGQRYSIPKDDLLNYLMV